MKILVITLLSILLFSSAVCFAQEMPLEKAYKLYYSGKHDAAIRLVEDYIRENPDPAAYYFLGYAYYEKKQMPQAAKYFQESFARKPFYSPMPSEK